MNWLKKIFKKPLYPEVEKAGGLVNALNHEFIQIQSIYRARTDEITLPLVYAYSSTENEHKSSQLNIAAYEKLFMIDFWRDGVCLANGASINLLDIAKAIDFWFNENITTRELAEKFSFIKVNDKAKAFDEGREVEYTWNKLAEERFIIELDQVIKLAICDEVLKKLFPFTSLFTLCFSRCTGYPFDTENLPCITPKKFGRSFLSGYKMDENTDGIFIVSRGKSEWLGEGNAQEAIKIARSIIPDNIEPARIGTFKKTPVAPIKM